ncbi:MAG: FAD-dependent oxidoreductase [Gammaproteobacteria bacterium]|nr:FAD-dependent oxidoreductase [Gammaproteobacteria bacterium]
MLGLEEAVKKITSDTASIWGIPNRGLIRQGYTADMTIFDESAIDRGPEYYVQDVPGDGHRYVRDSVGVEQVIIGGAIARGQPARVIPDAHRGEIPRWFFITRRCRVKESIAVVGAGICGCAPVLALARAGHNVTLVERDPPPPAGGPDEAFFEWNRRGAAQFRHPHAFLAVMTNLLEESFPDLIDDFREAGARKVTFADMLPPELRDDYTPAPGDEKLWLLMCRRATMETVFRRYAETSGDVRILSDTNVTGILTERDDAGSIVMNGLELQPREDDRFELPADIVIDAGVATAESGNGSPNSARPSRARTTMPRSSTTRVTTNCCPASKNRHVAARSDRLAISVTSNTASSRATMATSPSFYACPITRPNSGKRSKTVTPSTGSAAAFRGCDPGSTRTKRAP